MRPIACCLLVGLLFSIVHCRTRSVVTVPYPSPVPGSTALRFLPGIVTSDSLDFNSAFSPDGKSFFFGRSSHGRWHMLITKFDGKQWTAPELAPFSENEHSQADPFFGPDGTLYYISDRPKDASDTIPDYDIWSIRPLADGKWSAPENVAAVNSDSSEYYVSLAANGNIYFSSSREGGYGSADEQWLLFTALDRADGFGSADIYVSKTGPDKKWQVAKNAGNRINTPAYEYCSYLTRDGKYYFFSSELDVKWISSEAVKDPL